MCRTGPIHRPSSAHGVLNRPGESGDSGVPRVVAEPGDLIRGQTVAPGAMIELSPQGRTVRLVCDSSTTVEATRHPLADLRAEAADAANLPVELLSRCATRPRSSTSSCNLLSASGARRERVGGRRRGSAPPLPREVLGREEARAKARPAGPTGDGLKSWIAATPRARYIEENGPRSPHGGWPRKSAPPDREAPGGRAPMTTCTTPGGAEEAEPDRRPPR